MAIPTVRKLLTHKREIRSLRKEGRRLERGHPRRTTVAGQIKAHRRLFKKGHEQRIKKVLRTGRGFK